jgi:hypothetical protein
MSRIPFISMSLPTRAEGRDSRAILAHRRPTRINLLGKLMRKKIRGWSSTPRKSSNMRKISGTGSVRVWALARERPRMSNLPSSPTGPSSSRRSKANTTIMTPRSTISARMTSVSRHSRKRPTFLIILSSERTLRCQVALILTKWRGGSPCWWQNC